MAAAGPLMSFLIAAVLGGLWILSRFYSAPMAIVATLGYSAYLNAILGGFNLIPALPLDGGRVLRGTLWQRTRDLLKATAQATIVSKAISMLMIIVGFLMIVFSDVINGLWIFFLGWFIKSGAENSLRQTRLTEALSGVSVGDIMTRPSDGLTRDDNPTVDHRLLLEPTPRRIPSTVQRRPHRRGHNEFCPIHSKRAKGGCNRQRSNGAI